MQHGNTAAETCKLNGWVVGTLLTGDEGYGPDTIRITAIGEESVLAIKTKTARGHLFDCYEGSWTFTCRDWVRADVQDAKKAAPHAIVLAAAEVLRSSANYDEQYFIRCLRGKDAVRLRAALVALNDAFRNDGCEE